MDTESNSKLSSNLIEKLQREKEASSAKSCAEAIKRRCNGKSSMGTSIHARVPWYETKQKFFFDEEFMRKCVHASATVILEKCAGKEYFKFLMDFFDQHYFLYDNGFEGIQHGCTTTEESVCTSSNMLCDWLILKCGNNLHQLPSYSHQQGNQKVI